MLGLSLWFAHLLSHLVIHFRIIRFRFHHFLPGIHPSTSFNESTPSMPRVFVVYQNLVITDPKPKTRSRPWPTSPPQCPCVLASAAKLTATSSASTAPYRKCSFGESYVRLKAGGVGEAASCMRNARNLQMTRGPAYMSIKRGGSRGTAEGAGYDCRGHKPEWGGRHLWGLRLTGIQPSNQQHDPRKCDMRSSCITLSVRALRVGVGLKRKQVAVPCASTKQDDGGHPLEAPGLGCELERPRPSLTVPP